MCSYQGMTHTETLRLKEDFRIYHAQRHEGEKKMKKAKMIYIGIAALVIGMTLCADTLMQIVQNEIHWMENICRII
jgi:hypothetical protein